MLKKHSPKKFIALIFSVLFTAVIFTSCKKNADTSTIDNGNPPDLTTKVRSSVSGFVTDQNDVAVMGATVQFGTSNTTTDKYGYFEAKNVQVVKEAAVVTVSKAGYFKGIKTYVATEGKAAFFRIKLIPKTIVGNINAASGGTVTLSNGLSIKLPASGIINAATNASYTGTVNVAAFWINPTASDLNKIMPGDLRGINTQGSIKLLQTFGMTAVELTGASGELLQIATGQKATLSLPIPSSLSASAPATIPLWYFDETKGLWKQEGSATKTGNAYVGDVGHFSYWNCDISIPNAVQFECTVVNSNGQPIPHANVWIDYASGPTTGSHGFTDANGYASGLVPANSQLVVKISDYTCSNSALFSLPFTTTTINVSLGTIALPPASNATITGTLLNCNNQPVTSGYIMVYNGSFYTRYDVNSNTGSFNFNRTICGNNNNVNIFGIDNATAQQSAGTNITLNPGTNNIGNILACGNTLQEFFNYSINGNTVTIAPPTGTIGHQLDSLSINSIRISASTVINNIGTYIEICFNKTGVANGSMQSLTVFNTNQTQQTTIPNPINVHITEYGVIGEFIGGNFTGTVVGATAPNTVYTVNCNFRVKRLH